MKEKIRKILKRAIKKAGFRSSNNILVEKAHDAQYGDYATNIALILAKKNRQSPQAMAKKIIKNLPSHHLQVKFINGFINFYLSEKDLADNLKKIISYSNKWRSLKIGKGKTIIIDYSAPNIAKSFGIGHLRSTIIGQTIYNFYKFLGCKVIGDNHIGDWGTQFGKIIYAVKEWGDWSKIRKNPISELQKLYVKFHQEAEKNPEIEKKGRLWFQKLEKGNKEARHIWQKCVDWSWHEFDHIYKLLNVKFDYTLGESFYEDRMSAVIRECKNKRIAKMSHGSLVINYPSGITPGIIIKSDGATTYLTRDLATLKYRLKRFKPSKIIYHVGNEQTLHFQQLFETARLLSWANSVELIHARHGLVRTKEGKFSTRAGRSINLEDLINRAINKARGIIRKKGTRVKDENRIAQMIGIGAIKYTDLSSNRKTDIIFDWKKMFALTGNSAPYLQYTYSRCRSILAKTKIPKFFKIELLNNSKERMILRKLIHFPEVVEQAADEQLPNLLTDYLYKLSSDFNSFYNKLPVLKAPKDLKAARLALVAATSIVIKKGLELLGIETPEKM